MTLIAILLGGVAAAAIGSLIAHNTKISEFRQLWIEGLRADIADYLGRSHRWIREWENIQHSGKKTEHESEVVFPLSNKARVILWRIRLRLNPRENKFKREEDQLLKSLDALLNPNERDPRQPETSWLQNADRAVMHGRELLKKEWEVTKWPWFKYWPLLTAVVAVFLLGTIAEYPQWSFDRLDRQEARCEIAATALFKGSASQNAQIPMGRYVAVCMRASGYNASFGERPCAGVTKLERPFTSACYKSNDWVTEVL